MFAVLSDRPRPKPSGRIVRTLVWAVTFTLLYSRVVQAADGKIFDKGVLNVRELLRAGGVIGYVTIALSVAMVALIVEHLLTIRRKILIPDGFAEKCQKLIASGQLNQAETLCREQSSLLSYVVGIGLQEVDLGTDTMVKAMEDALAEQSARLIRKIEYLSLIAAIGPMLGLTGTVWGMIQAFAEFADKVAPRTADFAPSISEALVTTMFGLLVAVPAQVAFAMFRNRIDSYIAETAVTSDTIMAPLKRKLLFQQRSPDPRPARTVLPTPPAPLPPDGGRSK